MNTDWLICCQAKCLDEGTKITNNKLLLLRCGIALSLNKLSQYLDESQVTPLFLFFVPDALNDRHADVQRCMLDAALSALNTHGKVPCALPSQSSLIIIS